MLEEVLKFLQPRTGGTYIDGTLGGGGHTEALLQRSAPDGRVLGIDTDSQALERVKKRLAQYVDNGRLTPSAWQFRQYGRDRSHLRIYLCTGSSA